MTLLALIAALLPAYPIGESVDIELIRPWFSEGALPGIDSPQVDAPGTVRVGTALHYERDPLILYERRKEQGVIISHRQSVHLGAAWDLGRSVSVRISLPTAMQWGTEIAELAREGPLLGDLGAGLRVQAVDSEHFSAGLHGDLLLPTGTRSAWMGEALPRGSFGVLTMGRVRPLDALAQLSMTARVPLETDQQFTLGSELIANLGLRFHVVHDQAALAAGVLTRTGFDTVGIGGANNSSEITTALQLSPSSTMQWDIGMGKGLGRGYGSSEFRAYSSVTWIHRHTPPQPMPQLVITQLPDDQAPAAVDIVEEPDVYWLEDELAKVEGEHIVIRDPIQFEFATEHILPESLPTLRYVAGLLGENWQIAHIVVEGHASEEGSFLYNYDLSERRARSVWEELIRVGAHPDRMSYRGMGETVPVSQGKDEASLARNRRVEFKIVRQYAPDEQPDDYRDGVRLPWSGDAAVVAVPVPPPATPPPTGRPPVDDVPKLDIEQFMDDDEVQDDGGASPSKPSETAETP